VKKFKSPSWGTHTKLIENPSSGNEQDPSKEKGLGESARSRASRVGETELEDLPAQWPATSEPSEGGGEKRNRCEGKECLGGENHP